MPQPLSAKSLPLLLVPAALVVYVALALYVDDPVRASALDRFVLHNTDETFRYHHVRHALERPVHLLSSYARPVYTAVAALFEAVPPGRTLSLRLMNALFSAGALWLLLLLCRRLGLTAGQAAAALLITAASPTYLLHSVSVQATPMCALALLGSLLLLHQGRLAASATLAGLLPLIRPEGTVSLLLWTFFILRARGRRGFPLLALLFGPMAAFVLLNRLALGPGVMERVQYHAVLLSLGMFRENPFANLSLDLRLLARPLVNYINCIGPMVSALALGGLILMLRGRRADQQPLLITAGFYFGFYALFTLPIGFGLEKMSAWGHLEYAAAPLIPLIGLLAALPLNIAARRSAPARGALVLVVILLATGWSLFTLESRRGDFRFHWRPAVSAAQMQGMHRAAAWLRAQLLSRGVHTVYLSAEDGASGLTNMFIPYLPEGVHYRLLLGDDGEPLRALNMGTFTFGPPRPGGALYLASSEGAADLAGRLGARALRDFPAAGLRFYAFPSGGAGVGQ